MLCLPIWVNAQIINPGAVLEKKAVNKVNQEINKGADKVINQVTSPPKEQSKPNTAKPATPANAPNTKQAPASSNPNPAAQTPPRSDTAIKPTQATQPALQISSKFDFTPGEKLLFFDDFSAENIGDFPIQWNTNGSGEIVNINTAEGRWFKITGGRGVTTLAEPLLLPDNYTIEFDIIPQKDVKNSNNKSFSFWLLSTSKPKDILYGLARPGDAGVKISFEYNNYFKAYYRDGTPDLSSIENEPKLQADKKYRISIWVQKERFRLYVDQAKVFDVAKAISKNYKYNMIRFDNGTPMIANVRIATGLPDMRSKLITEGKLVSYGIYFDVNKDVVKPESAGTLKMIADVLNENPTVRIKIIGHTDSDGDDAANLDLSKRRSASVKTALVSLYGIDASRIETDGKGEKEPVAPNDEAVNKAKNRRVEFIKL